MEEIGIASALMSYFEKKPGQSTADFVKEIKELSEEERYALAVDCAVALGKKLTIKK